ncbi:MAG: hypothetical protein IJD97_10445 [Clostridia bacterium]|nr:hypothetical protein [Clostridia bacterium]
MNDVETVEVEYHSDGRARVILSVAVFLDFPKFFLHNIYAIDGYFHPVFASFLNVVKRPCFLISAGAFNFWLFFGFI